MPSHPYRLGRGPGRCGWLGFLLLLPHPAHATAPAFTDPAPAVSHDGTIQTNWTGAQGERFEVELRQGDEARVVYTGRMPSAHVSGLVDGEYALRVRAHTDAAGWTEWSSPKPLTVEHHPMSLVMVLMSLGLLTFAATATVVVRASRRVP